jgi:hypothetical protein
MRSDLVSWRPASKGDRPRHVPSGKCPTSRVLLRSDCREVTAGVPNAFIFSLWRCTRSTGGAAISLACTHLNCAIEMIPSRSVRPLGREAFRNPPLAVTAAEFLLDRHSPRKFSVAGVGRFSRLCVLMNPILPGAIHPDLAGEILENASLAARTVPRRHKRRT